MALEVLRKQGAKGNHRVLDADIRDVLWTRHSAPVGTLVRYADDFVVREIRTHGLNGGLAVPTPLHVQRKG